MSKFHGEIGFAKETTANGVTIEDIEEKAFYGEIFRNSRSLQSSDQVNDNVNISNQISIIADPYAQLNFHAIRYAKFMGTKWKVTDVEVRYPRLILTLGGVYNGR